MQLSNSEKKILILGSKPNADFDAFDIAYCANAASSFYSAPLAEKGGQIYSVISASELMENFRKDQKAKTIWLNEKKTQLVDNSKSKVYLTNYDLFPNAQSELIVGGFSGKIELMSARDLANLQFKVCSKKLPTISPYHINGPLNQSFSNIRRFVVEYIKSKVKNDRQISGLFRPSTGVIALLAAIKENGLKAHYQLAGIGITGRGVYPDGWVNNWTPNNRLVSFHVLVDRYIIELISKKVNLDLTDPSLKYLMAS